MTSSEKQYKSVLSLCKDTFLKKMSDYGIAWRILRIPSIADQVYIKVKRIRTIQEKGKQRVKDDIRSEYIGIINYALIGLMQLEKGEYKLPGKLKEPSGISKNNVLSRYNYHSKYAHELFMNKNHDYGDAWRQMGNYSFTDLILVKLLRMRQIQKNKGKTILSEGVEANLYDIINYSIFALLKSTIRHPAPGIR